MHRDAKVARFLLHLRVVPRAFEFCIEGSAVQNGVPQSRRAPVVVSHARKIRDMGREW